MTTQFKATKTPKGIQTFIIDVDSIEKTANYTLLTTDNGKYFSSLTDGMEFTLPSVAAGYIFTIYNIARAGFAGISISPAALDFIAWAGNVTDDKDLINTKATAQYGDFVTLKSNTALTGWEVVASRGIWDKEA